MHYLLRKLNITDVEDYLDNQEQELIEEYVKADSSCNNHPDKMKE